MFGFLKARNTVAAAMVSATLVGVHAQEAEAQARTGAVVDGMSAVVGVATHALSVNPILPLVGLGFKAATLQYTDRLPETERTGAYAFSAATWQGSAAANVCATASALSGGSFLPACLAVGMAWGWKTWKESARERRMAERCAALREFTGKRNMPCAFMPRGIEQAEAPARTLAAAQDLVAP